ncbi:MAG: flagellar basal body rod C-terminal domain-containing protein [Pseudomonadota bacterium]
MTAYLASASSIAISGLQAASARVAIRAGDIANLATPGYRQADISQVATPAGPRVTPSRPPGPAAPQGLFAQVDLPAAIVDMNAAKRAFEASAKVLKTSDEMADTLLEALA